MLRWVLILVAASVAFGFPKGPIHNHHDKIVGGWAVLIESFPYTLSLQYQDIHVCGASLLSSNVILTAAHCAISDNPSDFRIRAGSTYHDRDGQVSPVKSIHIHPSYTGSSNQDYDACVMILREPVEINHETTASIALATKEVPTGTFGTVSGWGVREVGGNLTFNLLAVQIPVISREACREKYDSSTVTDRMICAASLLEGIDACQGDSGGPFEENGVLIGIISWGIGCGDRRYPGVYTNVVDPEIHDFIESFL